MKSIRTCFLIFYLLFYFFVESSTAQSTFSNISKDTATDCATIRKHYKLYRNEWFIENEAKNAAKVERDTAINQKKRIEYSLKLVKKDLERYKLNNEILTDLLKKSMRLTDSLYVELKECDSLKNDLSDTLNKKKKELDSALNVIQFKDDTIIILIKTIGELVNFQMISKTLKLYSVSKKGEIEKEILPEDKVRLHKIKEIRAKFDAINYGSGQFTMEIEKRNKKENKYKDFIHNDFKNVNKKNKNCISWDIENSKKDKKVKKGFYQIIIKFSNHEIPRKFKL